VARKELKLKAVVLRASGKTYAEIAELLKERIPKSTLSNWCSKIEFSEESRKRIEVLMQSNNAESMKRALQVLRSRRIAYLESIEKRVSPLLKLMKGDQEVGKIAVAMLYLGEGSKNTKCRVSLGNSDPALLRFFVNTLRRCYAIDESKLRCTLQCRADQDIPRLESFWSKELHIPLSRFYRARIDPRTIGKKSLKLDYKGVCRIDYMSADLFLEIMAIGRQLTGL